LPIVNKAMYEFMVNRVPVERTILACDDLREFQMVKKISKKYDYIMHGEKILKERCIRCFASKYRSDGGLKKRNGITKNFEKLESTPDHAFLWNESVIGVRCPDKLDKQWYINKTKERLESFGVI
jgi:DNA polymerase